MEFTTLLAVIAIVALGGAQYLLMYNALRDLVRRPRVRGGNKVAWGLCVLCLPIVGALIYGWMGPTSFLSRPQTATQPRRPAVPPARNVTPITQAPSIRQRRASQAASAPTRVRRNGSRSA